MSENIKKEICVNYKELSKADCLISDEELVQLVDSLMERVVQLFKDDDTEGMKESSEESLHAENFSCEE